MRGKRLFRDEDGTTQTLSTEPLLPGKASD
jgi:hypothetical protein